MAEEFKVPNGGYSVRVLRKQDVLNAIDDNIIDKEIALDIIKRLEITAADYLKAGKWTGIPHLGSIRVPPSRQKLLSEETKLLIQHEEENLDRDRYILFRKDLSVELKRRAKQEAHFKYVLSRMMTRNLKLFKILAIERGEAFARVYLYCCSGFVSPGLDDLVYGYTQINNR